MTLEEAKKILEKEFAVISLHKSTEPFEFDESGWIEHEKPSVLEAFRVLSKGGYYISISGHDYNMREKRLKKEYEENTKAPGSAENHIKEDSGVNPALKEAASQFNDALLDEQGKKIESLEEKCKKYAYVVDSLEDKLRELKSENRRIRDSDLNLEGLTYATRELKEKNKKIAEQAKKIKRLGKEITRLNKIIHKKNEELRLTKIREKNLAELGLKYVGENEKLKKKLAEKIVDKIDAQALKSAESALAYKEKVIAEKDEVIADLGKELAAQKDLVDDISLKYDGAKHNLKLRMDECEKLKKQLDSNTKMVQKMAEIIVHKKPVTADVFKKCCIMAYNEEKLSKVLDDAIDQFLLFGEIIIKEEK